MSGDEVLQHVQPFTEIGGNRSFNNFAGRFRHQAAHTGQLADLLFRSTSTGIGHDVNRVEVTACTVVFFHHLEHLFRDAVGDFGPDFNDFVVAFALGNCAFLVLILDLDNGLFSFLHQGGFLFRNHHVVNADGNSGAGCVQEPKSLHFIQHLHGDLQTKAQVAVMHHLRQSLFL